MPSLSLILGNQVNLIERGWYEDGTRLVRGWDEDGTRMMYGRVESNERVFTRGSILVSYLIPIVKD